MRYITNKTLVLLLCAMACNTSCSAAVPLQSSTQAMQETPASVGVIKMLPDGTLQVFLMGKVGGSTAEKFSEIKKGDERYDKYIAHVGGINPGGMKSIPPWKEGE